MAGGLWDKLRGTLGFNSPGEGAPLLTRWNETLPSGVLAKYFSALSNTSKVVRHIEHGDTPSVLLDLAGNASRATWQQRRNRYNPQGDSQLFSNLGGWRVDQMMRFGEVCAALEPINHRDIPGFFLNTLAQGAAVIEAVGPEKIGLQFDLYHCQITEGDIVKRVEKYLPITAHMQVADNPGRNEPGTGEVNWPFVFRKIDELGFRGWIGCEYKPAAETNAGLGWFAPYKG